MAREHIKALVERSSFGGRGARTARSRISASTARAVFGKIATETSGRPASSTGQKKSPRRRGMDPA